MGIKVPITSGFMIVLDDQQFARAFFVDRVYSRVSTYFSVALKSKDVFFSVRQGINHQNSRIQQI